MLRECFYSIVILLGPTLTWAGLAPIAATKMAIHQDLREILRTAKLAPSFIDFQWNVNKNSVESQAHIACSQNKVKIEIDSKESEWSSTFYYALQKLGFLFPHPRIQVSPSQNQILSQCSKKFIWKPIHQFRGMHLHTMHPNEWIDGFFDQDKSQIANDFIRWEARNGQNVMQLIVLRTNYHKAQKTFKQLYQLARDYGILFGVDISFTLQQQKGFTLIGDNIIDRLIKSVFESKITDNELVKNLTNFQENIPFDFMTLEIGSSEFSSSPYETTLRWIESARKILDKKNQSLFIKIHTSSNQFHPDYGNFNFLPQYSNPMVGVLPHTVMYYSLEDKYTPVYGRENFQDMKDFMLKQNKVRPTWYYPETSYFIGMDIDVPLFLTDYLSARSQDMALTYRHQIPGHLNFTTGQELGYWLKDWSVTLFNNQEYLNNPYIALELLGEDIETWKHIFEYQNYYFKQKMLYPLISTSNLMDELPIIGHKVHKRNTLRELSHNKGLLSKEISLLNSAIKDMPSTQFIKNDEIRLMLDVTHLRIYHAYYIRAALYYDGENSKIKSKFLDLAKSVRVTALNKMQIIFKHFNRYPDSIVFYPIKNDTSYNYGYAYPARTLYLWEREEKMIKNSYFNPFFMNLYRPVDILL